MKKRYGQLFFFAAIAVTLTEPPTLAQQAPTPTFEVVSIRPSAPNAATSWLFTPDGYRMTGVPLSRVVLMAYFPGSALQSNRLKNMPTWVTTDRYDIQAKVAPADVAEWQKNHSAMKPKNEMLQAMLQAMLAERCKLVVHRVQAEMEGEALVIGKHGPKLKEAKPGEELPKGVNLPGDGVAVGSVRGAPLQWTFHHASMDALRSFLATGARGGNLEDRTGLTGSYDFMLSKREDYVAPAEQVGNPDPADFWNLEALGLELRPVKVIGEVIVVDHIERPSEN
jgi:uncharacterized protein (TIGR03435 family)